MAQSPVALIATNDTHRSITVAMRDDVRIKYFVGDRYEWLKSKLQGWLNDEWYNYVLSQLTKNASEIEVYKPDRTVFAPNLTVAAGTITGRISSMCPPWEEKMRGPNPREWLALREQYPRASLSELADFHETEMRILGHLKYGPLNWANVVYNREESDVANAEYKDTPSREYSFTVIAPQAQTFHYHQKRRWFKTEQAAKDQVASVLEEVKGDIELAVVQMVDVFKRKPKVELVSTVKKSSTRSKR